MATRQPPLVPLGDDERDAAVRQTPWRSRASLSSMAEHAEQFLARAGFDRDPWMAVALAAGIGAWFVIPTAAGWVASIAFGLVLALAAAARWKGRDWHILTSRRSNIVAERALAAACERADIVLADRWLPRSCEPRWLNADRRMLESTGGLSINLADQSYRAVADSEGEHGWWRGREN